MWNINNFPNFTIWKINILQYQKLLNVWDVKIVFKKYKKKFENKMFE